MKISDKQYPSFFEKLNEDDTLDFLTVIEKTEHRREATEFVESFIDIEINEDTEDIFRGLELSIFVGQWKTERWTRDMTYGENDDICELTKVISKQVEVVTSKWVDFDDNETIYHTE